MSSPTSTAPNSIRIVGARTHNLKNVDLEIPHGQLVVITGPSGSGKSSLAFDTIYAEGQRQFLESLSINARQMIQQMPQPDLDSLTGLQPTLCLDQSSRSSTRRSTVGTMTEIYDYLRLLMSRVGQIHCYGCGEAIQQSHPEQICDRLLQLPERTKVIIYAPMIVHQPGEHRDTLTRIRRERLVRARVDGEIYDIEQVPPLAPRQDHTIEAVTDRIIIRDGIESRLLESIENAVRISSDGQVICSWLESETNEWKEKLFSTRFACPDCDIHYSEVQPRTFSFNSPFGACESCDGLGQFVQFDPQLTVDRSKCVSEGAILAWSSLSKASINRHLKSLSGIMESLGVSFETPLNQLGDDDWEQFLNSRVKGCLGLNLLLEQELYTTSSDDRWDELEDMKSEVTCWECNGSRLSNQARAVYFNGLNLGEIVNLQLDQAYDFFATAELDDEQTEIAAPIIQAILRRLSFLQKVGVSYLTLGRSAKSLSGGEHQRVRLASSIGSGLSNVCYILDEPSIGLHPRDTERLIETLKELQQKGNSILVVEHDESIMRAADQLIDIGPGAGPNGGIIVSQGSPPDVTKDPNSLTGQFLSGQRTFDAPLTQREIDRQNMISIRGARGHNLQAVDIDIPLKVFCCVTGVSGSGKSTLINQTLVPAIKRQLDLLSPPPKPFETISGIEGIDKLLMVDQSPIGRSPRACPATFCGIFDHLRKLFSATKQAKKLGFGIGRFSFNSKTGWCPDCQGLGAKKLNMDFMSDLFVPCETCSGKRFNLQTLKIRFGGLSMADVLALSIDQAIEFFDGFSRIRTTLRCLSDVGLGYIQLGQPANTLSGGEAQRIKLATELAKPNSGNAIYILDEPTTGLHFEDINMLYGVLQRLVDQGNSVIVIEHNIDMIRNADWIIDLGPEGGNAGGCVVATGRPCDIANIPESVTGRFLQAN